MFLFDLRLILLTHPQIRLKIRSTLDGGGTKFLVDGIIGLIQFPAALFHFIREE